MDIAAVTLLLSTQDDRFLEDHTLEFLDLAYQIIYPDNCLCTFYYVELNTSTKAKFSSEDPRGNFCEYVEWALVQWITIHHQPHGRGQPRSSMNGYWMFRMM